MSKNKTRTKDKYRVVYNDTQRIELENEFRLNEYIAIPRKQEIAHKLQLSERQIKIWFQNRRAKKRKQQKRHMSQHENKQQQQARQLIKQSPQQNQLPDSTGSSSFSSHEPPQRPPHQQQQQQPQQPQASVQAQYGAGTAFSPSETGSSYQLYQNTFDAPQYAPVTTNQHQSSHTQIQALQQPQSQHYLAQQPHQTYVCNPLDEVANMHHHHHHHHHPNHTNHSNHTNHQQLHHNHQHQFHHHNPNPSGTSPHYITQNPPVVEPTGSANSVSPLPYHATASATSASNYATASNYLNHANTAATHQQTWQLHQAPLLHHHSHCSIIS